MLSDCLNFKIRPHNGTPTLNSSVIAMVKTEVENVTTEVEKLLNTLKQWKLLSMYVFKYT